MFTIQPLMAMEYYVNLLKGRKERTFRCNYLFAYSKFSYLQLLSDKSFSFIVKARKRRITFNNSGPARGGGEAGGVGKPVGTRVTGCSRGVKEARVAEFEGGAENR